MEKLAKDAALSLQESVLGGAVVLLIVLLFVVLRMTFNHIKDSDKRWSETLNKNTDALNDISKTHRESGDKIAISIERAMLYGRDHRNDNDAK